MDGVLKFESFLPYPCHLQLSARFVVGPQGELTAREVGLHNQKLALESVVKELQDTKQTVDRFRCVWFLV